MISCPVYNSRVSLSFSHQLPLYHEQAFRGYLLDELCFNIGYQLLPTPVDLILGIEQGAAFAVSERLQGLDLSEG